MNPVFMGIGGIDVRKWRDMQSLRGVGREELVQSGGLGVGRSLGFSPTGDPTVDQFQTICETEKSTSFKKGLIWGGIGGLLLASILCYVRGYV